jgi:inorganic pyrophosphatase
VGAILASQRSAGQKEMRNDRIIAVAEASVLYASVHDLSDLEPMVLKQIEDFFVNYQKVREVEFILMGHDNSAGARKLLERASEKH